jgi:hypothetical protein
MKRLNGFLSAFILSPFFQGCERDKTQSGIDLQIINTTDNEFSLTVSRDGTELFFTRAKGEWGKEELQSSLFIRNSMMVSGVFPRKWILPMNLTTQTHTFRIMIIGCITFSNQPIGKDSSANLWYVDGDSKNSSWRNPVPLDSTVNF